MREVQNGNLEKVIQICRRTKAGDCMIALTDGTYSLKGLVISNDTITIVKEAQASGIRWVTVTGRSDRGARPMMENYGLSCDYILMNGAEFRDTNGN